MVDGADVWVELKGGAEEGAMLNEGDEGYAWAGRGTMGGLALLAEESYQVMIWGWVRKGRGYCERLPLAANRGPGV